MVRPQRSGLVRTDFLNPSYRLEIGDHVFSAEDSRLVLGIDYESADGILDECRVALLNPDNLISNKVDFYLGKRISLWAGYGADVNWIGSTVITKWKPAYPRKGVASIELVGYPPSYLMMETDPQLPSSAASTGPSKKKHLRKYPEKTLIDSPVRDVADYYGFEVDFGFAGSTGIERNKPLIQPADMSDYDFILGLANIYGFLFWVDYEPISLHSLIPTTARVEPTRAGVFGPQNDVQANNLAAAMRPVLHFVAPDSKGRAPARPPPMPVTPEFTFDYNLGDGSSLLEFFPEAALKNQKQLITVVARNPFAAKTIQVAFVDDGSDKAGLGSTTQPSQRPRQNPGQMRVPDPITEAELPSASTTLDLVIGDKYMLKTITTKRFTTEAEVEQWVRQWFRRYRQQFLTGDGAVIGIPELRARQVHTLRGLGTTLEGEYYFSRVRHSIRPKGDLGYEVTFTARKLVV